MKNNKSYTPKAADIKIQWHFMDATDIILGKLAADISSVLQGKNDPTYTPHQLMGDKVVVTNAEKVAISGKKLEDKVYHRYTGFPGGIRTEKLGDLMERRPTEALRRAVQRMLPQNKLTKKRMKNLYIYKGSEHPHEAQKAK